MSDGRHFALIYIGLGDKDEALNWLEKGMNNHSEYASYMQFPRNMMSCAPSRVSKRC